MVNMENKNNNLKNNKMENILSTIVSILVVIFLIGSLRLILQTRVPYFTVPTCSMYPEIKPGDILLVEGWDINNIKPGDIIVYRGYSQEKHQWIYIVHRVKNITIINGTKYLITAGDYNIQICKLHNISEFCCYDIMCLNDTNKIGFCHNVIDEINKYCPGKLFYGFYPSPGLPLKKCPVIGKVKGFCVAGKVITYNGKPVKIPFLGEISIKLRSILLGENYTINKCE